MEIQEANKIIAEYMGWRKGPEPEYSDREFHWVTHANNIVYGMGFSESLDDLVPVWEKSGLRIYVATFHMGFWSVTICTEAGNGKQRDALIKDRQKTIQGAAAIATAKALEVLRYEKM